MRILSINRTGVSKRNSFGMSLHVPKNTKNLLDSHMRKRVIDPIEWLATARALESDSAHYEIISRSNKSIWNDIFNKDVFVITRHSDDAEVRAFESSPEDLLATIQSLDSLIGSKVQVEKNQIDNNIIVTTSAICKQRPEIKLIDTKAKPIQELENKPQGQTEIHL